MKNNLLTSLNEKTVDVIVTFKNDIKEFTRQNQMKMIKEYSPYTQSINDYITKYNELYIYNSLKLKEARVTRSALIRDIDLDMFVTHKGKTNRELILSDDAPYAYDSENGLIELHHIGQSFNSPFAELTIEEHLMKGNNLILHSNVGDGWRSKANLEKEFNKERIIYWRKRLNGEFEILNNISSKDLPTLSNESDRKISSSIRETIEELFSECTVDDLNYLSDAAKTSALVKQVGVKSVNGFINAEISNSTASARMKCVYCNSNNYSSNGSYKTKKARVKRYVCNDCGKPFTPIYKSIISNSNLSLIDWLKFINCMYNGYSVQNIAKACGISEQAVHKNKYKLFYALKILDERVKLRDKIIIDETYVPLSFKGNHTAQIDFIMPRKAHARGGENHKPGVSKNQVCIVCALDSYGNSVAHIGGCGGPNHEKIKNAVYSSFDAENVTCLYADMEKALTRFAQENDLNIKQTIPIIPGKRRYKKTMPTAEDYKVNRYLQIMNSYHSRLLNLLSKFSGTSSKLLAGYLYLFTWKERNKNREIDEVYRELLEVMLETNQSLPPEDIANGSFLVDPIEIEKTPKKPKIQNLERAHDIYYKYSQGQRMNSIAKEYGMTKQNVSRIINKYRQMGLAYKTFSQQKQETLEECYDLYTAWINNLISKGLLRTDAMDRNIDIYNELCSWQGSKNDFYVKTAKKYKLKLLTVKNIISQMKRIVKLQESFYIDETYTYDNMFEAYRKIYGRYQELSSEGNKTSAEIYRILESETDFKSSNIRRIIQIMNSNDDSISWANKRLPKSETLNRDRALFIDYLRWEGTVSEFYTWAENKYNLCKSTIGDIITFCLNADPKRNTQVDINHRKYPGKVSMKRRKRY